MLILTTGKASIFSSRSWDASTEVITIYDSLLFSSVALINSEVDGKGGLKFLSIDFRVGVFEWCLEFDAGDFLDFGIDLELDFRLSFFEF